MKNIVDVLEIAGGLLIGGFGIGIFLVSEFRPEDETPRESGAQSPAGSSTGVERHRGCRRALTGDAGPSEDDQDLERKNP